MILQFCLKVVDFIWLDYRFYIIFSFAVVMLNFLPFLFCLQSWFDIVINFLLVALSLFRSHLCQTSDGDFLKHSSPLSIPNDLSTTRSRARVSQQLLFYCLRLF